MRMYFQEKSSDQLQDVIYRPYLPKGIFGISFQLLSCKEIRNSMY